MQIDCTDTPYLCIVNMPKGLWLVNPKFIFNVMVVNVLDLSEKQIEDLRTIFVDWSNDKEEVFSYVVCSDKSEFIKHNEISKLFLQEIADAIISNVSIMTQKELKDDRMSFHNSMEE